MLKLTRVNQLRASYIRFVAQATSATSNEYSCQPEYPPIRDLTHKALKRREANDWHEEIRKVPTVEEKIIKVNMPRYYGYKVVDFNDNKIPYNALPVTQHYTRTVLKELPLLSADETETSEFSSVAFLKTARDDIIDALELAHDFYNHQATLPDVAPSDSVNRERQLTQIIVEQLNRALLQILSADYPHLNDVEVDYNPRHEAFWAVGGVDPPKNVVKSKKGRDWQKDDASESVDRLVQYTGAPYLSLRHRQQLCPWMTDGESKMMDPHARHLPRFNHDARTLGYRTSYQHAVNVPGYWPSANGANFGLLSFQSRASLQMRHKAYGDRDLQEALHALAIKSSYSWLLAQANYNGFNTYNDKELGLTTDDEDYIDPTLHKDTETDVEFQTAIDDDQSNQSQQQLQQPQQRLSGNSSASSGGSGRAAEPRKSKTKYFFNSSKSSNSANASASGSDNNKDSNRKLSKKMKQNAKELTLSSVKPAEQSVGVTMMNLPGSAGSSNRNSTESSAATAAAASTNNTNNSSISLTTTASGSDKKSAEKKISTSSNSGAAAAAAAAAATAAAASLSAAAEAKQVATLESKRKMSKNHRQREAELVGKNAEEQAPTDVSDSSDSEENNVPFVATTECTSTHEGRQIVHTILPISVDTLFNLLFTKSKFVTDFHAMRKSTDLIMGEWTKNEEGLSVRVVNVTVQLAASVGPKTSKVTEYQTMRPCSKPGELYSIDINSVNAGIPYADSFSVLIHFCLARTVDDHTMLSIHTQIKYKKSIWGVVKGFIEKNTWAGVEDFFGAQLHALQSETCIPPAKGKGRRPRRGTATQIRTLEEAAGGGSGTAQTGISDTLLESHLLSGGGVAGSGSVGAASGHALLHEHGKLQQLSGLQQQHHHQQQHLQKHLGGVDLGGVGSLPLALGQGQGHRFLKHKGLSLFVILLLCLMLALNVILLLKLWKLEERIDVDLSRRARFPSLAALKELPNTNEEWLELLRQQEQSHEGELRKWQQVLQTAIELLKKTEKTLAEVIVR